MVYIVPSILSMLFFLNSCFFTHVLLNAFIHILLFFVCLVRACVHNEGTIRIVAGDWRLAVPRALTSKMWRQAGVSDAADVYCWQLFAESQDTPSSQHNGNYRAPGYALVVASDGVWGTLAASDAARLVGQYWGKGGEKSACASLKKSFILEYPPCLLPIDFISSNSAFFYFSNQMQLVRRQLPMPCVLLRANSAVQTT